jgi:hypothetical protein
VRGEWGEFADAKTVQDFLAQIESTKNRLLFRFVEPRRCRYQDPDRAPYVSCNRNYRVFKLKNGGKFEVAQQMAAHESARTTGLYDRRGDEISLDEVERIVI